MSYIGPTNWEATISLWCLLSWMWMNWWYRKSNYDFPYGMHAGIQFKNTFSLTRSLNSFVVPMMTPDTLKDSRYELLELILLKNGKEDRVNFCTRPYGVRAERLVSNPNTVWDSGNQEIVWMVVSLSLNQTINKFIGRLHLSCIQCDIKRE